MPEYPVFVKRGDARPEVDALLQQMASTPEAAGLLKHIYVQQAQQTVVMVTARDAPIAEALRGRKGWAEPRE